MTNQGEGLMWYLDKTKEDDDPGSKETKGESPRWRSKLRGLDTDQVPLRRFRPVGNMVNQQFCISKVFWWNHLDFNQVKSIQKCLDCQQLKSIQNFSSDQTTKCRRCPLSKCTKVQGLSKCSLLGCSKVLKCTTCSASSVQICKGSLITVSPSSI